MSDLAHPSVDLQIVPRVRDLGGFAVQRILPSARRKMVGPFIFLDVRPHPHIGLATVTYLFAGEILHRDSVGSIQAIRPGDVNWMTAGRGIAHSERTPGDVRAAGGPVSGLQMWVALPRTAEEGDPGFTHHDRDQLPVVEAEGLHVRVVAGSFLGVRSPVPLQWETLLADVTMAAGAVLPISAAHDERALYLISGAAMLDGQPIEAGPLYVLKPGLAVTLTAVTPVSLAVLGGEPMDGPRHIWWNFVSSSQERIEQARADWMAGRFALVPGETERIDAPPLPTSHRPAGR